MIDHLDNLMRHLFLAQIAELTSEDQVRFRPPDNDWRQTVIGLERNALNIYLFDLRENRTLRSNERVRSIDDGVVTNEPAPARIDCHYLITAWSPVLSSQLVWDDMQDQHALLYQVMAVLMNHAPLNPSRIYAPDSAELAAVPLLIREADLPTQILPVEGFAKYAEFWGTMGADHRWKPAIYLVVTLPVAFDAHVAGPIVTTRIMDAGLADDRDVSDIRVQIAGRVLDATGATPEAVANAWVQLLDAGGETLQVAHTDAVGRFTFDGLSPGEYQLNWRARGFAVPAAPRVVRVPSSSGEYDLRFT